MIFGISIAHAADIRVGTKNFTEGYILGEITAQVLEQNPSINVERKFGLGGTGIVYQALINNEIDLYVDYTGTLSESILKKPELININQLRSALEKMNITISRPLGFNNTYALAVRREFSESNNLKTISDLLNLSIKPKFAFSYEFMSRKDGFDGLKSVYNLPMEKNTVKSMEHSLLYKAIENKVVDIIEVYSTDAKIESLDLVVLKDDKNYFPNYEAVLVANKKFVEKNPKIWIALKTKLENSISEDKMRKLNKAVDIDKESVSDAASAYLETAPHVANADLWSRVTRRTKEHLLLVGISLFFAILIGIPLGVAAFQSKFLGQIILFLAGVVQTIPSLALLCFLIPAFGIGIKPALIALFLYSLFPIILNTFTGLKTIDPSYIESSNSLGLTWFQKLWYVEIPLVSPQILSGVKTSAIISIGTATLAALIGAGGYGAPIVSGLALNDMPTILVGAIPAAVMALAVHLIFDLLKYIFIPKGLRINED